MLDIGSLTIDATTLTVIENDPQLKLREGCSSQGGRCGVVTLHCQLLEVLTQKFGGAFSRVPESKFRRGTRFCDALEDILEGYTSKKFDVDFRLPLKFEEGFMHTDYEEDAREIVIRG